ncbi:MAG: hypothetical protein H7Y13_12180 [Sphingobacteriaceae bacterium]|nr:hypothetical protein [Sphingobacteriaceae bacterium]
MNINQEPKQKLKLGQDALAQKVAGGILRIQLRIANYLNRKTAHFSKIQKEILLLCFSLVFSLISLYLIFKVII